MTKHIATLALAIAITGCSSDDPMEEPREETPCTAAVDCLDANCTAILDAATGADCLASVPQPTEMCMSLNMALDICETDCYAELSPLERHFAVGAWVTCAHDDPRCDRSTLVCEAQGCSDDDRRSCSTTVNGVPQDLKACERLEACIED